MLKNHRKWMDHFTAPWALPLTAVAVPAILFAFKKSEGHATREEMDKWARKLGLGEAGCDYEHGKYITQSNLSTLVAKDDVDAKEVRRYLEWYAYDGLKNMFETLPKLRQACETLNRAIALTGRGEDSERLTAYLRFVDALLYTMYRLRRTREYANILVILAVNWQKKVSQGCKSVEGDLREKLTKAEDFYREARAMVEVIADD